MDKCVSLRATRHVRRGLRALVMGGALALGALVMSPPPAAAQNTAAQAAREDLVAKIAGKRIHKDKATGQVRAITVQEARDLIASIVALTSGASGPLPSVVRADGAEMVALDGHFGHVVISRYNADGTVSVRCIASADEAADFLAEEPLEVQ